MVEALQGGIEHTGKVGMDFAVATERARECVLEGHETRQHQGLDGSPRRGTVRSQPQRLGDLGHEQAGLLERPLDRVIEPGREVTRNVGQKRRRG